MKALIHNGRVVDVSEGEFPVHEAMQWVDSGIQAHQIGWTYDPETHTASPPSGPSLEETRGSALKMVDDAAGDARARVITVAPGMESVYAIKLEHARAYRDAGYTGDVPSMVAAEAAAANLTATEAADYILMTAAAWTDVAAAIEQVRQTAKVGIRAAESAEAVNTILTDALLAFLEIIAQ